MSKNIYIELKIIENKYKNENLKLMFLLLENKNIKKQLIIVENLNKQLKQFKKENHLI